MLPMLAAGGIMAGVNILSDVIGGLFAGDKPEKVEVPPLNIGKIARDTVQSNVQNFGDITELASKTNRFNQEQVMSMLDQSASGWKDMAEKQRQTTMAELSGQLPQDVIDQVQRFSASKALGLGFGQGGAKEALTARDLGLSSLQLMNQGFNHAQGWLQAAQSRTTQPMNAASMFVTPNTALGLQVEQNKMIFGNDLYNSQVAAAPDPFWSRVSHGIGGAMNTMGAALLTNGLRDKGDTAFGRDYAAQGSTSPLGTLYSSG